MSAATQIAVTVPVRETYPILQPTITVTSVTLSTKPFTGFGGIEQVTVEVVPHYYTRIKV